MATAIDIAHYIYNKKGYVDSQRLNMLVYYSQAWSLGWFGRPITSEEFQAREDGTIQSKLLSETTHCRSSCMFTVLLSADIRRLSDRDKAVIDSVLDFYGDLTGKELTDRFLQEKPWQEAYESTVEDTQCQITLSLSTMKSIYALQEVRGEIVPERPDFSFNYSDEDIRRKLFEAAEKWEKATELLAHR